MQTRHIWTRFTKQLANSCPIFSWKDRRTIHKSKLERSSSKRMTLPLPQPFRILRAQTDRGPELCQLRRTWPTDTYYSLLPSVQCLATVNIEFFGAIYEGVPRIRDWGGRLNERSRVVGEKKRRLMFSPGISGPRAGRLSLFDYGWRLKERRRRRGRRITLEQTGMPGGIGSSGIPTLWLAIPGLDSCAVRNGCRWRCLRVVVSLFLGEGEEERWRDGWHGSMQQKDRTRPFWERFPRNVSYDWIKYDWIESQYVHTSNNK